MKKLQTPATLFFCALLSSTTFAVDGVLEINHTCAVQLGCFSGDSAGYPVTIDGSAGGSYRLSSNLIVPGLFTHGVQITSPSISIDLNGFEIVRAGCEQAIADCTPEDGSGIGVSGGTDYRGISVRNGSITGMGKFGVGLWGEQAIVEGVRARWNRNGGIYTNSVSTIRDNMVYENGDFGIHTSYGSTISGNTAYGNRGVGLSTNGRSTVTGNTAYDNGLSGISASGGSTVRGNTVNGNGQYGLSLSSDTGYGGNVVTGNTVGTVAGGHNTGSNSCDGGACP